VFDTTLIASFVSNLIFHWTWLVPLFLLLPAHPKCEAVW